MKRDIQTGVRTRIIRQFEVDVLFARPGHRDLGERWAVGIPGLAVAVARSVDPDDAVGYGQVNSSELRVLKHRCAVTGPRPNRGGGKVDDLYAMRDHPLDRFGKRVVVVTGVIIGEVEGYVRRDA